MFVDELQLLALISLHDQEDESIFDDLLCHFRSFFQNPKKSATKEHYSTVLSATKMLVHSPNAEVMPIIREYFTFFAECTADSSGKRMSFDLIAFIFQHWIVSKKLIHEQHLNHIHDELKCLFRDCWAMSLPKLLWQLGNQHLLFSDQIVDTLIIVCNTVSWIDRKKLLTNMTPFHSVTLKSGKIVLGPYASLPEAMQVKVQMLMKLLS